MEARGPVRGTADVELEVRITEDDETVEYVEATDTVRYIGGWRRASEGENRTDRIPIYESTPFSRWSETKCVEGAAKAAATHVNEQLGTNEASWSVSSGFTDERRIDAVVWVGAAMYGRDDALLHQTTLDFEQVVAETPTAVRVSYQLDGNEREMVVPIYTQFDVFTQE